ncbi:MAG: hypothetical protein AABZ32_05995 [Bacteroidota bacterium]
MKQIEVIPQTIRIKPFSLTQLAKFYGCGVKTVKTWIRHLEKEIGPRMGYYYTPKQVRIIFEEVGVPADAHAR